MYVLEGEGRGEEREGKGQGERRGEERKGEERRGREGKGQGEGYQGYSDCLGPRPDIVPSTDHFHYHVLYLKTCTG